MNELTDNDKMCLVYALRDETGLTRYIGITTRTLGIRLRRHLYDAKSGLRGHRCNWIRSMICKGNCPSILEIQRTASCGADLERNWISLMRAMGWPLVNLTDGGDGTRGVTPTPEHRMKISKALTGIKRSEQTKALIRLARAKQLPAHTTPHSEATKILIRQKLADPLIREKIGAANRGKKRTLKCQN